MPTESRDHNGEPVLLEGWGRTAPTMGHLVGATDPELLAARIKRSDERGIIGRGLGRSYGDAAQNAGGLVVDGVSAAGILSLDVANSLVTARAGTSLDQLMTWLIPLGWFVPVTPGTRSVTIGGAIAADIHGKDHHLAGSWCSHVESFRLMTGDGSVIDVDPEHSPDVFWATAGGMGLTGVILDATIRLKPIETSRILVDTDRAIDLDDCMALLSEGDDRYDYTVAWIDLVARGRQMGRSILTRGRFARLDEVPDDIAAAPLEFYGSPLATVPPMPGGLLNKASIRAFNELWYRKSPWRRRGEIQTIGAFFHPLDMARNWNRLYGPRGVVQWQFVVPFESSHVIEQAVRRLSDAGLSSFLAVLKRFGPGDPGHLSFPIEGWTLALDIPVRTGLGPLLDDLDGLVAESGGRLYLAKDARMRPELVPVMYPHLDEWRAIRNELDPNGHFQSDLSRRLDLC